MTRQEQQALTMAIKTLEQRPCKDCISREAVLMELDKYLCGVPYEKGIDVVIKDLPSVTPQPKIGRWRHYEGMLICSECGAEFYDDIMEYCGDDVPKCCPNCGTKMEDKE